MRWPGRTTTPTSVDLSGGLAVVGTVWVGGDTAPVPSWTVLLDRDGRVDRVGPADQVHLPSGVRRIDAPGTWVGPGLVDAHVHLAFGAPSAALLGGLVGVRDLGAPPELAARLRTSADVPAGSPHVRVTGPLLTAPGGYPSTSWGRDGFARFIDSPAAARAAVRDLVAEGVDLVKVALEPAGGPVPTLAEVRAVVEAAHAAGLRVTAHALGVEMVVRALDAGVDELCHTPTQRLAPALVDRIASAGVVVVSTLQTFFAGGEGSAAAANAAALVAAGVTYAYGTDLGNAGTKPGVAPAELERVADAGLGRLGALRAATVTSAGLLGGSGLTGRIGAGDPAAIVVLAGDPLADPQLWRTPSLVVLAGRAVTP